jgi:two-component system, OmpR family, sensor kinase
VNARLNGLSLQSRLLAGLTAVALVLSGVAVVIITTTRRDLMAQVDRRVVAADDGFRHFLEGPSRQAGSTALPPPRGDGDGDGVGSERPSDAYQGVYRDGALSARYRPNLGDFGSPIIDEQALSRLGPAIGATEWLTVNSETANTRYRVLVHRLDSGVTVTAMPLHDTDETMNRLLRLEALGAVAVVLMLGAVAFWVVRLGIRPIKQMTATAGEISAANAEELALRVPEGHGHTEAGQLAVALNAMLGRIESAVSERARSEERLRQFVADASHELRTPVTTIRGYAELYRHGGLAQSADLADAMRRTEQESLRMGRLVEDLLTLAKLDQHRALERQPVNLGALVADAAHDAAVVAPERSITTAVDRGQDQVTLGDADRLRQVLANLVANALAHTPVASAVVLEASRQEDQVVVVVRDQGPGMTPEVAARVTERFYRADPARARNNGGSGLGMAIVDAIVAAHGGTVRIVTSPAAGTAVTVSLPAAPATATSHTDRVDTTTDAGAVVDDGRSLFGNV